MIRFPQLFAVLALAAAVLPLAGGSAQAQASRTWVSGVGNDANPCSRTAPCKTFAGAISKTASGGEIDCLDSAGYGAVTITKAMTLNCLGVIGSVLVSGTNGIVVQAGPSDVVYLRGIELQGIGTGINGIRFLAGKALVVDNCVIYGFTTNGIDIALGATASATVKDTTIANLGGVGIRVATTAGTAALEADHVNISRVNNGVEVNQGGIGTVSNSSIFGNGNGVLASFNGAVMNATHTVLANNNAGANASVAGATVALTNNDLFANNTGVSAAVGSFFVSGNDNKFSGNASNGASPSSIMVVH
jgi:parallel beta helix pectate lyase-like protein